MNKKKSYPALIVKKQWLDLILSGDKTWEIRRGPCTKNLGKIYLIESGTNLIVDHANFVENIGPLSVAELNRGTKHSCVDKVTSAAQLPYGERTFAWKLDDAKRLKTPIQFKYKKGPVIWINVDI